MIRSSCVRLSPSPLPSFLSLPPFLFPILFSFFSLFFPSFFFSLLLSFFRTKLSQANLLLWGGSFSHSSTKGGSPLDSWLYVRLTWPPIPLEPRHLTCGPLKTHALVSPESANNPRPTSTSPRHPTTNPRIALFCNFYSPVIYYLMLETTVKTKWRIFLDILSSILSI